MWRSWPRGCFYCRLCTVEVLNMTAYEPFWTTSTLKRIKTMDHDQHALIPIWKKYPEIFASEEMVVSNEPILKLLSEIFIGGDFYYYIIDTQRQTLSFQHPNLCSIHGLITMPTHLQHIINLIHPEDIPFVLRGGGILLWKSGGNWHSTYTGLKILLLFSHARGRRLVPSLPPSGYPTGDGRQWWDDT